MSRIVVLDSGPLGLVANPRGSAVAVECQAWLSALAEYARVVIPEIADYEVRRELLRANRTASVRRLDELKLALSYVPITTDAMLLVAELWAVARQRGRPTTDDRALDGDVILAAQARVLDRDGVEVIVATANVDHLALFVPAEEWQNIPIS